MSINTNHPPLTDEASLRQFWTDVMAQQEHHGRSLWLAFHDADGSVHRAVTCVEGLPLPPDPVSIANLNRVVAAVREGSPDIAGALLLLTRGGTDAPSIFEEAWADALAEVLVDALVWPLMVATPYTLRCIPLGSRRR